jgi:hypothetical protein
MFESDPSAGSIDIRRADVLVSVTTQMIGAEGINGDDHNIESSSIGRLVIGKELRHERGKGRH